MNPSELREQLYERRKNGKGIPAFNYSDMWDLMAIVQASASSGATLLAASNPLVAGMISLELCNAMVDALNVRYKTKVFNHLDHSKSVELCTQAVDIGYPSVMIDGSDKDLKTNIRMVKEVVRYAHSKGVVVEAEIGRIKGAGVEGDYSGGGYLAEVEDAVALAESAEPDTLAVGIGTAHGFYAEEPRIHFDRLAEIASKVSIPLVLHGGTGVPDRDIRKAISLGITKVNVGTMIHATYMNELKKELNARGENPYTLDVMKKVLPSLHDLLTERIALITGA